MIYKHYLSDPISRDALSDQAFINAFLQFERALALSQAALGMIPAETATNIDKTLSSLKIEPATLAESTLANGIPSIGILQQCKKSLDPESARFLHFRTTSQDAIDTAHMLMYQKVIAHIVTQLTEVVHQAADRANTWKGVFTIARTRTQHAGPTTYGARLANWFIPLIALIKENEGLTKHLKIQLSGAFGTQATLGPQAAELAQHMAAKLNLTYSGNWQTSRLSIKSLADWLVSISGTLGKYAADMCLLTSTDIAEVTEDKSGGGQSSAMPHKSNPILSEAILALSQDNNIEILKINQAQIHRNERDGAAWILEWKAMKTLLINTATMLSHTLHILTHMTVDKRQCDLNLQLTKGLIYSPLAQMRLNQVMPAADADIILKTAIEKVAASENSLDEVLQQMKPDIDWRTYLVEANYRGTTDEIVESFINQVNQL